MKNICFYFQVHIPYILRRYRFFEIGKDHYYYDDFNSENNVRYYADYSFLPANRKIADLIRETEGKFKCAFSICGTTLDQLERYAPEVIDSFKELSDTGCVEFLAEPYSNSLASVYNDHEFEIQVRAHEQKIKALFGVKPKVFRNSELIYSDEIGEKIHKLGYNVILSEGAKHVLGWKSPNYVYKHAYLPDVKVLVRNHVMSNHIPFNFSNTAWDQYPLTADKYTQWIADSPADEKLFNLWMGYESFGCTQKGYTGIFEFLSAIPAQAAQRGIGFVTPSEAAQAPAVDSITAMHPMSWSGEAKDLSSWTGNHLQEGALNKLYSVAERVNLCKEKALKQDWLAIQDTNYMRYMSFTDSWGTQYGSPYEAFINYMNILADFLLRVDAEYPTSIENEELNALLNTINDQDNIIADLQKTVDDLNKKLASAKSKK